MPTLEGGIAQPTTLEAGDACRPIFPTDLHNLQFQSLFLRLRVRASPAPSFAVFRPLHLDLYRTGQFLAAMAAASQDPQNTVASNKREKPRLMVLLSALCLCSCEQNISRAMSSNKSAEEQEFEARLAKAFYKTTAQNIGQVESKLPAPKENGINGKFTDHLIYSGMYKNASLNTTADKDRWLNGSKDWMEHLG